jgi:hypothetical protein
LEIVEFKMKRVATKKMPGDFGIRKSAIKEKEAYL